ncbi:MAG: hypothetical protein GY765_19305 [bacterium]|nr:hypothetical protein [bacterium]
MKILCSTLLLALLSAVLPALSATPLYALETVDQRLKEEVEVVNIEIPVRVYQKKKQVKGLKKDDFKILIEGKEVPINGFYEVRRTLKTDGKKSSPRMFALIFNVSSYTLEMEQSVDTLFRKLIRPGDRLMIMTNNFLMKNHIVHDPKEEKTKLQKILKLELARARVKLSQIESGLRYLAMTFKSDAGASNAIKPRLASIAAAVNQGRLAIVIRRFIVEYLDIMRECKSLFFDPTEAQYLEIAETLRAQSGDKWVLNFYQTPKFPQLKMTIDAVIYKRIEDYYKFARKPNDFQFDVQAKIGIPDLSKVDNISRILLSTGASFHSMLLRNFTSKYLDEFTYQPIAVDAEYISRRVTKKTNGITFASDNIEKFLNRVTRKTDVYYVMTYVPPKDYKKGKKIKILPKNKLHKTVYDNLHRAWYLKKIQDKRLAELVPLRIESLEINTGKGNLALSVSGVLLTDSPDGLKKDTADENEPFAEAVKKGTLLMDISIVDDDTRVVRKSRKAFNCKSQKVPLALRLPALKKGNYQLIISLRDINSKQNDMEIREFSITSDFVPPEGGVDFAFLAPRQTKPAGGNQTPHIQSLDTDLFPEIKSGLAGTSHNSAGSSVSGKNLQQEKIPLILSKISDYCKRLERISLHFFCIEDIREKTIGKMKWNEKKPKEKTIERNHLTYGYQLARAGAGIAEKRVLFNQNGWKRSVDNAPLKSHFRYEKIVYGPLVLSERYQPFYNYQLVDKRERRGKEILIIEVSPKPTAHSQNIPLMSGRFWVDADDYSILRIETYQKSLRNFSHIAKTAKEKQLEPYITIINEFEIIKRGIRFPSKIYCEEAYKNKQGKIFVQSIAAVTFKDYKFFNIAADVLKEKMGENK